MTSHLLTYTRVEAVQKLFGIKLTKHTKFKTKLSTLEDNGSIYLVKEEPMGAIGSRGKRFYLPSQLNRLHNVILISGFYSKPAIIEDVANNLTRRQEHIVALRELLAGRDRVGDIEFDVEALGCFFDHLELCQSFDDERLPNPFIQLPHVIDNGTGQTPCVLDAYNNTDVALTQSERMLAAYLDLEIEKAYKLSKNLESESGTVLKLKYWIEKEYREAQRFDDLLESFFK